MSGAGVQKAVSEINGQLNRILEAAARRGVHRVDALYLMKKLVGEYAVHGSRVVTIERDLLELEIDTATLDNFLAALQEVLKNEKH